MFHNKTITTLNIESNQIRVVSFAKNRITMWKSKLLPSGLVQDTVITDPDGVANALDDLFKSEGIQRNNILVNITGFKSVYHIAQLPRIKNHLMAEAVKWTARNEIPRVKNDYNLSWHILDKKAHSQKLLIIATPIDILNNTLSALSKAKIKFSGMYIKQLALARFTNLPDAIIVDLETDSISVILVVGYIPEIIQIISTEQEDITEDRIQKLMQQVLHITRYYNNSHLEKPLIPSTPIIFTGELCDREDVMVEIKKNIPFHVTALKSNFESELQIPLASYAANIGVVLIKNMNNTHDPTNSWKTIFSPIRYKTNTKRQKI